MFAEVIKVGAADGGLQTVAQDVVDRVLVGLHPCDVLFDRRPAVGAGVRGAKTQQLLQRVAAGKVGGDPFLDKGAELSPECGVLSSVLLGQRFEILEQPAGQRFAQLARDGIALYGFARDVERQIFRIHHALNKAQVFGKQFFVVLLNQNLTRIEPHPMLRTQPQRATLPLCRHKEDAAHIGGCIRHHVNMQQRSLFIESELLIEFFIFSGSYLGRGLPPQRGASVGNFRLILLSFHINWERNIVGMALDDALQTPRTGKLGGVFFETNANFRAALGLFGVSEAETAVPGRAPHRRAILGPERSGEHRDLFGDHKHRIEADAKLTDDLLQRVLTLPGILQKGARAGMRDRA